MIISIVNRSDSISDDDLQCVIRAINRQIAEDFEPYWSFGARLRLEGKIGDSPDTGRLPELRGDAVIYLWDKTDVENALGYHSDNTLGIPYGFVFTELSAKLGEKWSVTLSHEALELLGDAQGNLLVQGPHPDKPAVEVFHWFEMCDAVQAQTYKVDGVDVANFVLPLYFTKDEQKGGRNDFLGIVSEGKTLQSFGVAPGGYIGFFDPRARDHETWSAPDDSKAKLRLEVKGKAAYGRGYLRKHSQAPAGREGAHRELLRGLKLVKASATVSGDPIKHVVVLMLENRSFDHMLGGMSAVDPNVEGVNQGNPYSNKAPNGNEFKQQPIADWVVKQDLDHEHDGTMEEIGTAASPMSGFVATYLKRYPNASDEELDQVMAYFPFGATPEGDRLPALHALARNFAVCDHWFSSMPGPTWQNRFFAHSGTSLGHTDMPSSKDPGSMRIYYQETIYDRLSDANINWRIYHDGIPQSIVLTRLLTRYLTFRGYAVMQDFFDAAAGDAADFPEYAFIEPCYFGNDENDQHPPADVRRGDKLIADVYNAIRAKKELWESTLLLITCDEHGGFFDHVPPPATVAPDAHTAEWTFDRLGLRVPAILVSPWVAKGVIKTVFDHTSLLRYLCDKWNLEPLGLRMQPDAGDARANTFAAELTKLQAPRRDTPEVLQAAAIPRVLGAMAAVEPPIEGSREALLMFVGQLPEQVPAKDDAAKRAFRPGAAAVATAQVGAEVSSALSVAAAELKLERLRMPRKDGR
jgi:phospholipase C